MNGRLLSAFSCRQTSSPSIFGIMMSSKDEVGELVARAGQCLFPVGCHDEIVAVYLQPPRKDVAVRFVVVGDEDQGWLTH